MDKAAYFRLTERDSEVLFSDFVSRWRIPPDPLSAYLLIGIIYPDCTPTPASTTYVPTTAVCGRFRGQLLFRYFVNTGGLNHRNVSVHFKNGLNSVQKEST